MSDQKIAVVTGANRGLGKETCRQLAQKGIKVILTARNSEKGQEAARQLQVDTIVWLATLPDGAATGGFWRDRALIPW